MDSAPRNEEQVNERWFQFKRTLKHSIQGFMHVAKRRWIKFQEFWCEINLMTSVLARMKLPSLLMMQRMVIMRVIGTQSYQKDTHLMDKMVTLMNMTGMNMIMENHHQVRGSNASLVKYWNLVATIWVGLLTHNAVLLLDRRNSILCVSFVPPELAQQAFLKDLQLRQAMNTVSIQLNYYAVTLIPL